MARQKGLGPRNPALLPTCCVTLDKSLPISGPGGPLQYNSFTESGKIHGAPAKWQMTFRHGTFRKPKGLAQGQAIGRKQFEPGTSECAPADSTAPRSAVPTPAARSVGFRGPTRFRTVSALSQPGAPRGSALHKQTARAGPGAAMTQGPETAGKRKVLCR